jgi:hypothetical protein
MFIVTVKKKNKGSPTVFEYQHLVESIRTVIGPRQRFLLALGKLELPKEEWPLLAKRINEIVHGQERIFCDKPEIERLANQYAQALLRKYETEYDDTPPDFQKVDINSTITSEQRTIGAEHTALCFLKKLGLDQLFFELGLSQRETHVAELLIVGRLVHPTSERGTHLWAQNVSGLADLLETEFQHLSLNTLYEVSDKIQEHQQTIEAYLTAKEHDLFALKEHIILYDLTNTYFEGRALGNPKAKFGQSKEKRSDCRLVTLGLIIDGNGFPKCSRIFPGNQSEPKTLLQMVSALTKTTSYKSHNSTEQISLEKPTVVIDAGIATEANLAELKAGGYHYICVSRSKPELEGTGDFILVKDEPGRTIKVKRFVENNETYLYCHSEGKQEKEKSMQGRWVEKFEEQLAHIAASIHKKRCTKNYQKVCERIGRLRQKYSRIAHYYSINVIEKNGLAEQITWEYVKKEQSDQFFSGSYFLRTDRTDLTEKQIWDIYLMLKQMEDAFRALKSEMGLRPIHHKKERRCDSHLFITVLAYHVLHSIMTILKQNNIKQRWQTIRLLLSTHTISTIKMNMQSGKTLHVRKCSQPEAFHKTIYDALRLEYVPCKSRKFEA